MNGFSIAAICAIWRRQLGSLLLNPLGYVFILLFALLSSAFIFVPDAYFARNIADVGKLTDAMPWLLMVLLPALAMNSWALEREIGTEEHLLTLPLSTLDALIGKWLGVATFFTLALLCSYLNNLWALNELGAPDGGQLFANYLGWWLAGLAYTAVALFASTLVSMPSIAFVLGVLMCLAAQVIAWKLEWFDPFNRGLAPLGGVLSSGMLCVALLGLAALVLGTRRFADNLMKLWVLPTVGLVLLIGGVVGLLWVEERTVLSFAPVVVGGVLFLAGVLSAVPAHIRWETVLWAGVTVSCLNLAVLADRRAADADLTAEGLSSLHPSSVELLKEVEQPVELIAFISTDLPPELTLKGKEVEDALKVLDRAVGEKLSLKLYRPKDALDEQGTRATRDFGFTPKRVQVETVAGREMTEVFLGVAVRCGPRVQRIDHFEPGLSVEYELVRAIRAVSHEKRKVIGIVETDLKLMGGFDMQARRPLPRWELVKELEKQYEVREVKLDVPVGDDVDVLLAAQPSRLSDESLRHLHDYIWAGRPCLILEDPLPIFVGPTLGTSQEKRKPGNPMMQQQPGPRENGDFEPIVRALGLAFDFDKIAWSDYNPSHAFKEMPPQFAWSYRDKKAVYEHDVNVGIDGLLFPYPGYVRTAGGKSNALTVTPLVGLTPEVKWGHHNYNQHVIRSFFGMQMASPGDLRFKPSGEGVPYLGVYVSGKMKRTYPLDGDDGHDHGDHEGHDHGEDDAEKDDAHGLGALSTKPIQVVFIADVDMATDQMFAIYRNEGDAYSGEQMKFLRSLNNVQFLMNALDALAGDKGLLALRGRRREPRPLSEIEKVRLETQTAVREVENQAEEKAEKEIEAINKGFEERLNKIRERTDMDENAKRQYVSTVQKSERKKFDAQIEVIRRDADIEIRKAKAEQRKKIEEAQYNVRYRVILRPVVLMIVLALAVFGYRLSLESSIIPDSRRRAS